VLTILDGDLPKREITLGREDLMTPGSIVYSPTSKSVQFRLDVYGETQKATESVRSIKGGPLLAAIIPSPTPGPVRTGASGASGAGRAGQSYPEAGSEPAFKPSKTFTLPDPAPPTGEQTDLLAPEPGTPIVAHDLGQPVSVPGIGAVRTPPPPTPRPTVPLHPAPVSAAISPIPLPAPRTPPRTETTSGFIAPKATRQAQPVIPPAMRTMVNRNAEVRVKVTIDAAGKVRRADIVSSTAPVLSGSAISAAHLWRFEPARLDGKAVESSVVLTFAFQVSNSN
jgi:TonB family protein